MSFLFLGVLVCIIHAMVNHYIKILKIFLKKACWRKDLRNANPGRKDKVYLGIVKFSVRFACFFMHVCVHVGGSYTATTSNFVGT